MARYLVAAATKLMPLQAGDYPQPLAFIVPSSLDMTDREVQFTMEDQDGTEIVSKDVAGGFVELEGQVIIVMFEEADTKGRSGVFDWVLKTSTADELITIGYGTIQINKIK